MICGAPSSSRPLRRLPSGPFIARTGRQDAGVAAGWKPALRWTLPVGEPLQYGKAVPIRSDALAVRVVWDGARYRLWTASDDDEMPSSVAASNGVVATSATDISLLHCGFSWCIWASHVTWTIGTKEGSEQVGWVTGPATHGAWRDLPLPPSTIASARDWFVIAWPLEGAVHYEIPGYGDHRIAVAPEAGVRPGVACDRTDCVIAYGRPYDVHALTFEIGRPFRGPELLTVAATERAERVPQVHALGGGHFLVLYRSDGADGQRLSWRVLAPEPPQRKARAMR